MSRITWFYRGIAGVFAAVLLCASASAQIWDETIDGGGEADALPGTAQVIASSGPLNQITGVLPGPDDVDTYALLITNPAAFSAASTGGFPYGPPRLFLLDAAGNGVSGYFDSTNTGASLSGAFVPSSGLYYLAISGFSHPVDAFNNDIWFGTGSADVERAPDGLGATSPIGSWSGSPVPYGPHSYTITLTGAAPVPEPGTVSLLLVAGGAALTRRRRLEHG